MTLNATTAVKAEIDRILLLDLQPGERLICYKNSRLCSTRETRAHYSFVRVVGCDEIFGRELVMLRIRCDEGTGTRRFDWVDLWRHFRRDNGRSS